VIVTRRGRDGDAGGHQRNSKANYDGMVRHLRILDAGWLTGRKTGAGVPGQGIRSKKSGGQNGLNEQAHKNPLGDEPGAKKSGRI
jgi:hypothetical protein